MRSFQTADGMPGLRLLGPRRLKNFQYNDLCQTAMWPSRPQRREKMQHSLWSRFANADTSSTYNDLPTAPRRVAFWRRGGSNYLATRPIPRLLTPSRPKPRQGLPQSLAHRMLARPTIFAALLLGLSSQSLAQSLLRDDFEGPETSLVALGGDASYLFEQHARIPREAHSGKWCERIAIRGTNGTGVYVGRALGSARVINELKASIWVKSDRPGMQISLRIALPRSTDPSNGKPLTTLVRGTIYSRVGSWQQLEVVDIPQSLERQVRVLRTQFGSAVDAREARVEDVLLNVYGGPGLTNIWIDDLEVVGLVPSGGPVVAASAVDNGQRPMSVAASSGPAAAPAIEMRWPRLLVGGRPFFPRVIDYQGEPLSKLKALGFNVIRVTRPATAELLREAASLGLWVMAPPPAARDLELRPGETAGARLGASFDPVLVWDLGSGLSHGDLDATKRWAKLVAAADPRSRPLICRPDSELSDYTRQTKLLLAGRDPLGTTLGLAENLAWLRERPQLVLPGTPMWVAIQTEPPPQLIEQMTLIGGAVPAIGVQEVQIRMLVRAAMAAGARGLCFQSRSRLDASDPMTKRRAAMLELVNVELELIDRWPASGNFTASASSSDKDATGAVIETDRSRLLLPLYAPSGGQLVLGNPTTKPWNLTAPGVPEGDDAFELNPTSLRPLKSDRVAGGTRVLLGDLERDSVVVFSLDARVLASLRTRIEKHAVRAAQVARDLAAAEQALVDETERRLAAAGHAVPAARPARTLAADLLKQCDTELAAKDARGALDSTHVRGAYDHARRALAILVDVERMHWERLPPSAWASGDVWTANFATLPEYYRFAVEMSSAARGPNLLAEGGFEDLEAMRRAGWTHLQHPPDRIKAGVELSPAAMHSGRTGLRLEASLADEKQKISAIETPPLWITSPEVRVEGGTLLEIQGWVRVPRPLSHSVDGLLIIDSIGGQPLAQRVAATPQWRQFKIYRVAPQSGPLSLTFALSGLGEAWIDDVTIQVVQRGRAAGPQQAQQAAPAVRGPRGS